MRDLNILPLICDNCGDDVPMAHGVTGPIPGDLAWWCQPCLTERNERNAHLHPVFREILNALTPKVTT
jgi:hypothetical protein